MKIESYFDCAIVLFSLLAGSALGAQQCGYKTTIQGASVPGGQQTITYCKVDGQDLMHGDIILPPQQLAEDLEDSTNYAGIVTRTSNLWPSGRIPYVIDGNLSQTRRVTDAIYHWQSRTRIRFVPRTVESDYIRFVPGGSCSSSIGHVGGQQTIVLASGCDTGAVIHEIGHAVGLWHEQSRNDRDNYIQILWNNIGSNHRFNFNKFEGSGTSYGVYDYASIMHYEPYAFSTNGYPTMRPLGNAQIPNWSRDYLSAGDVAAVAYMYR